MDLPENLSDLTPEQLAEAQAALRDEAEALRDEAMSSDDAAERLVQIAGQYQRIGAELETRAAADAERAERVNAALVSIAPPASDDAEVAEPAADTPADAPAEPAAADTAPDETVAAAVETPAEPAAAEVAEPAPAAEPAVAAEVSAPEPAAPEPVDTPAAQPAAAPTPEPAAAAVAQPAQEAAMTTQPTTDPVAGMTVHAPADVAPVTAGGDSRPLATFVATMANGRNDNNRHLVVDGDPDGGRSELSRLFQRKIEAITKGSAAKATGYEAITLATATTTDFRFQLGRDEIANFTVMEEMRRAVEPIVASGGNCAPFAPRYDVFNVAEPQSPVEQALPVLGAPRGGVRYVVGPSWTDAREGVRVTTTAEDADGYAPDGPTPRKPCVALECPPIVECEVDAVSRCVQFGNLQYRTFPELVDVFLEHLAVAFAEEKEVTYLDAIDAGSTWVTGGIDYGATRSSYYTLALALHAYRKRNHMSLDAPLQVLAPDSFVPLIKADMVNDNTMGLGFLGASAETVARELLSSLNASVAWYYDGASDYSLTEQMAGSQAGDGAALNPWACDLRFYIYAPGTWARLDGGTLDVGLIRDSELNATNDLQFFAEQWVQACKLGNESMRLDLQATPNGAAPEWVSALPFCTPAS